MKKFVLLIVLLVSIICVMGCNAGLGPEIDQEPPVIKVEGMVSGDQSVSDFAGGIYCNKIVSFSGTARDNKKVEKVYTEIKWSDESEFQYFKPAVQNGDKWTVDVDLGREGTAYLRFVARDSRNNFGINSTKVITLLVDDTAPVGEAWYIDRKLNGIQYNLKYKEELEKIDLTLPENKDAAQNGSFAIKSSFNDTMGILQGSISISILDENDNLVYEDVPNEVTSSYAPVFEITHDKLASLGTGKHYLHIQYSAEDVVTVPGSNKAEDVIVDGGWFIWYPESDNPQISTTPSVDETGSINIKVENTIRLTLFDDDALSEACCALLKDGEYDSNWKNNLDSIESKIPLDEREKRFKKYTAENSKEERDLDITLVAPASPQKMRLVVWLKEKNGKTTSIDEEVVVTDASTPILFISNPENNSIPTVNVSNNNTKATVTIEGQTLDTTECKYLEFVWIPNSVTKNMSEKKTKAKQILDEVSSSVPASGNSKKTVKEDGILYSVKLSETEDAGQDFFRQTFSFNVDLFNDFILNSKDERNEDKYFYVKLTRKDGNVTYQEYILSADTLPPQINCVSPANDMEVVPTVGAFTLKFNATKSSEIPMDTSKYKIIRTDCSPDVEVSGKYNSSTGYYEYEIPVDTLEDFAKNAVKPVYEFYATDLWGNSFHESRTLVVSDLPRLNSITSVAPSVSKVGDEIEISANFTSTITLENLVNNSNENRPYLNVTGITNNGNPVNRIYYSSGSGTTTLNFKYVVQEGDIANDITVLNTSSELPIVSNGNTGLSNDKCHITTLDEANNLNGKTIKIDGIKPTYEIEIETSATSENINNGITYLRAGQTIKAIVTTSERVYMDDIPSFNLITSGTNKLNLSFNSLTTTSSGSKFVFSKTISASDINDVELKYDLQTCITNIGKIKDAAGNELVLLQSSTENTGLKIDTKSPIVRIKNGNTELTSGKYSNAISFTVETETSDSSIYKYEYSVDGGNTWNDYTDAVNVGESTQIAGKVTDYAGNCTITPVIYLEIKTKFPNFSLECTSPDGYYKTGDKLEFEVYFNEPVIIPKDCTAKVEFACSDDKTRTANITGYTADKETYFANFSYTVESNTDFYIEKEKTKVILTGIEDTYKFTQGDMKPTDIFISENVICDTKSPTAKMIPGTKNADSVKYEIVDNNVYSQGNKIKIIFNEPIQKGMGNVILRQTEGWAIPPVLTAEEYNTICNELTYKDKNKLARQDENGTLEEDMEDRSLGHNNKNNQYHGTGQFVGPYKKSMQGIDDENNPDIDTKFVLDFDIDIWETTEKHPVGKTFTAHTNNTEDVKPITPSTTTSAGEIRAILEKAGFHQRVLDVTSASIEIDKNDSKIAYVTFPAGLIDKTDELPLGREWELVIEEGAFLDMAGNSFGENNASSKAEVKINTENEKTFFNSDGVATPVIRVDRYSYGLGIKQSDANGNLTSYIDKDSVKPTGYVRVRIDCETKGATVTYGVESTTKNNDSITSSKPIYENAGAETWYTETTVSKPTTFGSTYTKVFALGSGNYKESYKAIVGAKATKTNHNASDVGYEGVFQTVVYMKNPITSNDKSCATQNNNTDISIRGTTGMAGEPYISPFPLRDSRFGSPYLRIIFNERASETTKKSVDYYWVSYEVLVWASFSGHFHGTQWNWAKNWGLMYPGEFTRVEKMKGWS